MSSTLMPLSSQYEAKLKQQRYGLRGVSYQQLLDVDAKQIANRDVAK